MVPSTQRDGGWGVGGGVCRWGKREGVHLLLYRLLPCNVKADCSKKRRKKKEQVNWCFTPGQPVQSYQGGKEEKERKKKAILTELKPKCLSKPICQSPANTVSNS